MIEKEKRKIELALFHADDLRWEGLCMIDGKLFKITFFPGSVNEEWKATLMVGSFVPLTEDGALFKAAHQAYEDWMQPSQISTRKADPLEQVIRLLKDQPHILKELKEALNG